VYQRFSPLSYGQERKKGNSGANNRKDSVRRAFGVYAPRFGKILRRAIGRNRFDRHSMRIPTAHPPDNSRRSEMDNQTHNRSTTLVHGSRPSWVPVAGGAIKKVRSQKANGVDFLTTHFRLLFSSLSSLGDGGWCVGSITRRLRKIT
jgi:hypothetical protein